MTCRIIAGLILAMGIGGAVWTWCTGGTVQDGGLWLVGAAALAAWFQSE